MLSFLNLGTFAHLYDGKERDSIVRVFIVCVPIMFFVDTVTNVDTFTLQAKQEDRCQSLDQLSANECNAILQKKWLNILTNCYFFNIEWYDFLLFNALYNALYIEEYFRFYRLSKPKHLKMKSKRPSCESAVVTFKLQSTSGVFLFFIY